MQAVGVTRTINGGMSHRYQVNQVVVDNKLEASHNRTTQNTYTNQEKFLQSGNTYARNFNRSLNHRSTIKYGGLISLSEIKKLSWFVLYPVIEYTHYDNEGYRGAAEISEDKIGLLSKAWRDSISAPNAGNLLRQYGIHRELTENKGNGYRLNTNTQFNLYFTPFNNKKITLGIDNFLKTSLSKQRLYDHYSLQYFQPASTDYCNRYNTSTAQNVRNELSFGTCNLYFFDKNLDITPSYTYIYQRHHNSNSRYLLNRLEGWGEDGTNPLGMLPSAEEMLLAQDNPNSVYDTQTDHIQQLYLDMKVYGKMKLIKKFAWQATLKPTLSFVRNKMDYRRGNKLMPSQIVTDTAFSRNRTTFDINTEFDLHQAGGWPYPNWIVLNYNFKTDLPAMTYLVNYRDDSNPLYIVNGNPHLKSTYIHTSL